MSLRPPTDDRRPLRENALQALPAQGALRQSDGQRTALVPLDFLQDLRVALTQEFGDGARHLLYCAGFDWSLRDMVRLGERLRGQPGSGHLDLWQMEAKFVLDSWWEPLADAGWGTCQFSPLPHGFMLAEITHSAPAAAGSATAPACDLCAGLFAGALSFFARAERHAVEVQCAALGPPSCLFIAGAPPHIDAVETWRQQNLPAAEIRRRIDALPDAAP
jgi:predicted hydrocarbon binding protein